MNSAHPSLFPQPRPLIKLLILYLFLSIPGLPHLKAGPPAPPRSCTMDILKYGEPAHLSPLRMILLSALAKGSREQGQRGLQWNAFHALILSFDPPFFHADRFQKAQGFSEHLTRLIRGGLIDRTGTRRQYVYQLSPLGHKVLTKHFSELSHLYVLGEKIREENNHGPLAHLLPETISVEKIKKYSEKNLLVHFMVLNHLSLSSALTSTELVERVKQSQLSPYGFWSLGQHRRVPYRLTRLIDDMVEFGWVVKRGTAQRGYQYKLTHEGRYWIYFMRAFFSKTALWYFGGTSS